MKKKIVVFIILLAVTLVSFALYTGMKEKETIQAGNDDADLVPEKLETVIAQISAGRTESESGPEVPAGLVENEAPDLVDAPPLEFDRKPEIYIAEKVEEEQTLPAERNDPEREGEPAFTDDIELPKKDVPVKSFPSVEKEDDPFEGEPLLPVKEQTDTLVVENEVKPVDMGDGDSGLEPPLQGEEQAGEVLSHTEADVPVDTAVAASGTALTEEALQIEAPLAGSNVVQSAGKGGAAIDDEPSLTVIDRSEILMTENRQHVPVEKAAEVMETAAVRDEGGSAGPVAAGKVPEVPVQESMPDTLMIPPVIIPENEIVRSETDLVQRAEKEEVIIEEEPVEEMEEEIIFKEEPAEIEPEEPVEIIEKVEPEKPLYIPPDIPLKDYGQRVAVLPFENFTENEDAPKHIFPLITGTLSGKGLEVIDETSLNDFLCKERIRSTGYVSKELAGKIRERFKVGSVLAGSILSFSSGENPRFGILARLIDSSEGEILWADYASATGEDFLTMFDLGKVNTLAHLTPRVTDMLFASFTVDGLNRASEPAQRIAVMPFRNNSDFKNAGMIAMHMFIIELLKNPDYRPVEYGNIRNSIVSLKIRNKGELSFNQINSLSNTVRAKGIVVGVVNNYSLGTDVSSPPKVDITVRLIDGQSNKIVWYSSSQLSGEENIIALDWGRIRSVHTVAYRVVTQLVGELAATARN